MKVYALHLGYYKSTLVSGYQIIQSYVFDHITWIKGFWIFFLKSMFSHHDNKSTHNNCNDIIFRMETAIEMYHPGLDVKGEPMAPGQ